MLATREVQNRRIELSRLVWRRYVLLVFTSHVAQPVIQWIFSMPEFALFFTIRYTYIGLEQGRSGGKGGDKEGQGLDRRTVTVL